MSIGSWKEWVRFAHRSEVHCGILTSPHCFRSHVETTRLHEYYWQKWYKPFISAKWANTLLSAEMKFAFRVDTRKQIGVEVNLTPKGKVAPVTFATRHCIYQNDFFFFPPHIFFYATYFVFRSWTRFKYPGWPMAPRRYIEECVSRYFLLWCCVLLSGQL